jgi:hypothetical protein
MRSPMDGRFRVLTVVDQWSRQSPILEAASSLSGTTVGLALDRVLPLGAAPRSITVVGSGNSGHLIPEILATSSS